MPPFSAGESVRLVALARIKAVHPGIHLVLKDAVRGSARCPADDEHAAAANINPDRISLIGGGFTDRPACRAARSLLALPTHCGHLRNLRVLRQQAPPSLP